MIHPAIAANTDSIDKIIAATSPNSPQTQSLISKYNVSIFETLGENFVIDLNNILIELDDFVFVTSGDLPLLDGQIVKQIVDAIKTDKIWTSVVSTKSFQSSLGLYPECVTLYNDQEYAHTGISIVNATKIKNLESIEEDYLVIDDKRICLNVNTKTDFKLLSGF